MDIIKVLQEMIMDMPDSSAWSFDQGWNSALKKAIEKIIAIDNERVTNES